MDMKRTILNYLNEKYSDPGTDDLLDLASLLNPHFKTTNIKNEKSDTTGTSSALPRAVAAAAAAAAEPPEVKRKNTLSSFFKQQGSTAESRATFPDEETIKVELRSYMQTAEVDSDTNPLEWWKCYQANFPCVAKLVRRYLCIPATNAPSERAFSTSRNIVTCHRAALKPDAVDRLVFLAQNL
ncbi:Zinc finger BED domain-containing protein 1 [Merluccius polli]|uniref:Zinc finger BED domain-containing protein 1 n=1 Tax=Merluccius polli TaxID=89951 RepID=A0AA47MJB8_MERPO|nr:Zinc finger BED domain-containing protein 1 [Merluccius polli]